MTRRTPQPGDSYCLGDVELQIHEVRDGQVYYARFRGPVMHTWDLGRMTLEQFHEGIAVATWGSRG